MVGWPVLPPTCSLEIEAMKFDIVVHQKENLILCLTLSQRDSYQGVLVTDGTKSYCLFLYHCDLLESSGAAIGFSSSGNFFFNHQLSLSPSSSEVACGNTPDSNWNSLLYQVHYDGEGRWWRVGGIWVATWSEENDREREK
jgi:hypothetical protein